MTKTALRCRETWIGFVIGIIGTAVLPLAVAAAIDFVNPPAPQPRRTSALADINGIEEALTLFSTQHGRLPTSEEGLAALIPDYLDRFPIDPWGNAYVYELQGGPPRITSYGSDGKRGGEGAASDVTSAVDPHRQDETAPSKRAAPRRIVISDATATDLFVASILLIPLIAYLATDRPLWSVGVLAGAAGLFAVLALSLCVVVLLSGTLRAFFPSLGVGLLFVLAAAGVLLRVRYADAAVMVVLASLVVAFWAMSGHIIGRV